MSSPEEVRIRPREFVGVGGKSANSVGTADHDHDPSQSAQLPVRDVD